MAGPLVGGCCFGVGEPGTAMTLAEAEKERETARLFANWAGAEVYYARHVDIFDAAPAQD